MKEDFLPARQREYEDFYHFDVKVCDTASFPTWTGADPGVRGTSSPFGPSL